MSENINAEKVFDLEGRQYTLTPPTLETELAYVKYLEEIALAKVHSHKATYGLEYRNVLQDLTKEFASGAFAWGSAFWWKSLQAIEHVTHLAWMMFCQKHPELGRHQCEDMVESHMKVGPDGPENPIVAAVIELVNLPNRRGRRQTGAAPANGSMPATR